jgi:hypothetical protein
VKIVIGEKCFALRKKTTYFEDRHFEGAVIFDHRIKRHFVKVKATLAAYAHLSL